MTEQDRISRIIKETQGALNRHLALGDAARALPVLAGVVLVLYLAWRFGTAQGWLPGAALLLSPLALVPGLVLMVLGLLLSILAGRRHWLDTAAAARWLDQRLGSKDIFGAALEGIQGRADPAFSHLIIAEAASLAGTEAHRPAGLIPLWPLLRAWSLGLGVCLASGVLFLFWNPQSGALALRAAKESTQGQDVLETAGRTGQEAGEATAVQENQQRTERQLDALFPGDQRLRALAREALQNQDSAALDYLLAKNNLSREDLERLESEGSTELPPEENRDSQPEESRSESSGPQDPGEGKDGQVESSGTDQEGSASGKDQAPQEDKTKGPESNKGQGPSTGNKPRDDEAPGGGPATAGSGGNEAGTGEAQSQTSLQRRKAAGGSELMVEQPDPGRPFEIILPDKEAAQALKTVIPDARRSAEAALSRRSAPLSYEQFVTSYFTILSQEAQP